MVVMVDDTTDTVGELIHMERNPFKKNKPRAQATQLIAGLFGEFMMIAWVIFLRGH